MLPSLYSGDWVMARAIEHIDHVSPNKMYVVVLQDSVMVKKIEKRPNSNNITLVSTNENYPPYDIKPFQIQEIWEVSSKLTFDLITNASKYHALRNEGNTVSKPF